MSDPTSSPMWDPDIDGGVPPLENDDDDFDDDDDDFDDDDDEFDNDDDDEDEDFDDEAGEFLMYLIVTIVIILLGICWVVWMRQVFTNSSKRVVPAHALTFHNFCGEGYDHERSRARFKT